MNEAGKGDTPRKVDGTKFRENFEAIDWRTKERIFETDIAPELDRIRDYLSNVSDEDIAALEERLGHRSA